MMLRGRGTVKGVRVEGARARRDILDADGGNGSLSAPTGLVAFGDCGDAPSPSPDVFHTTEGDGRILRGGGGGGGFRSAGACYQFKETGSCKFGDECRFSHDSGSSQGGASSGGGGSFSSGLCHRFRDSGECKFGTSCRFSHDTGAKGEVKDAGGVGSGSAGVLAGTPVTTEAEAYEDEGADGAEVAGEEQQEEEVDGGEEVAAK